MQILKAGTLYFALVFGAGFVLGPIRMLWAVPRFGTREIGVKIGVRSILLALSFRVKKVKKYVAYYLPVGERNLCLISGFSRKTYSARFKALLTPAIPKFNFFVLNKGCHP
jgi:hypothetical protein